MSGKFAGQTFTELCPGDGELRAAFLNRIFPGQREGYDDLVSAARSLGLFVCQAGRRMLKVADGRIDDRVGFSYSKHV